MRTRIAKVDPKSFSPTDLQEAIDLLKQGEVVAFPTETVYGLGGNALDQRSVEKIFHAKGRPPDNPLIVHIASRAMLEQVVKEIPEDALPLMQAFWPGPLTIIFPKGENVPSIVTAGLDTVAVRMPSHPIAFALIKESNIPIAAPSANASGRPSPTEAQHVFEDLNTKIPLILDGGSTDVGVESTVVDLNRTIPMILRPGGVSYEALVPYLPDLQVYQLRSNLGLEAQPPTPGLKYRHYAPTTPVFLVKGESSFISQTLQNSIKSDMEEEVKVGVIQTHQNHEFEKYYANQSSVIVISLGDISNPPQIAHGLFSALRTLDQSGCDKIYVEGVGLEQEGLAIMNRLEKAATEIIEER